MQASMIHFPYSFSCQPFVDATTTDCVTSSSPLSGSPSPPASSYASPCYDNIVTTRFRSHEDATSRFTGLPYGPPKDYTRPIKKLFTIEAILGLNEDKSPVKCSRASLPTIYTSSSDNKDSTPVIHTSHSTSHFQHSLTVSSSTSPGSKPSSIVTAQKATCGGKMKRIRTIFTPEQLERLELEFERQQYMVGPERMYLASSLGLSESQVKVWFQNRRIKFRKQHLEMQQARLAQIRDSDNSGENETETDHPSKEISSTHWDDICHVMDERN